MPLELVVLKIDDVREIGIIFECTWGIDVGLVVGIENLGTQHFTLQIWGMALLIEFFFMLIKAIMNPN